MELDLFSEQLGHIAAVAAFLGSNSWFGLLEAVDLGPLTSKNQTVWTYFYFFFASIGFACCSIAAVCSTFVMIYGTQKAIRGSKLQIEKTITEMYLYRKQLVKVMITAVVSNVLMAATVQLARAGEREEDYVKGMIMGVFIVTVGVLAAFCSKASST